MKLLDEICNKDLINILKQLEILSNIADYGGNEKEFVSCCVMSMDYLLAFNRKISYLHKACNINYSSSSGWLISRIHEDYKLLIHILERCENKDFRSARLLACGFIGIWEDKIVDYVKDWKICILKQLTQIYKNRLEQYRIELSLLAASRMIGEKLCPSRPGMHSSSNKVYHLHDYETYIRSDKHPLRRLPGTQRVLYADTEKILYNGGFAHVGDYANMMQVFGDIFIPTVTKIPTTPGDAMLYQLILRYKLKLCAHIAETLYQKTSHITVGFYNQYPCLMIHVERQPIINYLGRKPSQAAFEDWVNFLISYLVGMINATAHFYYYPIELVRRASFGFLTPTVAPTGESIRLNVGVIPKAYADLLIQSLLRFDKVLQNLWKRAWAYPIFNNSFYKSSNYCNYLKGSRYQVRPLTSIIHLLWEKIDRGGRTTIQNIMRTSYARDTITIIVYNLIKNIIQEIDYENHDIQLLFDLIMWTISKIEVVIKNRTMKLSFNQNELILTKDFFYLGLCILNEDIDFWNVIEKIHGRANLLTTMYTVDILSSIRDCIQQFTITHLYFYLDYLNELLFIASIEHSQRIDDHGDGYGSNSDEEVNIEGTWLTSKKIITHSGMRAILCAVTIASAYLFREGARVFLERTYYEVPLGLELVKKLHGLDHVTLVQCSSSANIIINDLNMCLTNEAQRKSSSFDALDKIMILDTTSALAETVYPWLIYFTAQNNRSKALFMVESGTKNQQLGADKNQYGVTRVITKERELTDRFYRDFKMYEPPLLSKVSHDYRRLLKSMGATPTTKQLFHAGTLTLSYQNPSSVSVISSASSSSLPVALPISTTSPPGFWGGTKLLPLPPKPLRSLPVSRAVALFPYVATSSEEISFSQGEKLLIIKKLAGGWWQCQSNTSSGLAPSNYLKEEAPGSLPTSSSSMGFGATK